MGINPSAKEEKKGKEKRSNIEEMTPAPQKDPESRQHRRLERKPTFVFSLRTVSSVMSLPGNKKCDVALYLCKKKVRVIALVGIDPTKFLST